MQAADDIDPEAGEFNLFLFCFLIAGVAALCILIVIGIIAGLLAFAAFTGIGVGSIAANAILAGLISKSPKVGLSAFILHFGAMLGLISGMALCFATRWLLSYTPFDFISLISCGILGAILGSFLAWISFSLLEACFRQIKHRIDTIKKHRTDQSTESRACGTSGISAAEQPRMPEASGMR